MRSFFLQRNISIDYIDFHNWDSIYTGDLNEKELSIFNNKKKAMDLFFNTEMPLNEIVKETGIVKSEIYRFASRCIVYDDNNKIMGYRGLISNNKIAPYIRKSLNKLDLTNFSGAFQLLLNTYPQLKIFLIDEYFKRSKVKNSARERKISYKNLHRKFINECRKLGIKSNDYPFNTTSLARKSVERFIKEISNKYIQEVSGINGEQSSMLLNNVNNSINSKSTITRPLERVEFDGHLLDVIVSIVFQTPKGEEIIDTLNRIWLLTVIDVATRAVIGYHLSFNKEYNEEDVKLCFQSAILPWKPKELTIPGLSYSKNAGFPSSKFSEAKYGVWDEISYDNAKSHLSKEIKDILTKQIGCTINMGPVAVPVNRPIVERLFKTIEENGFHRLPSTTGSNVLDPKRKDPEQNAIKFSITSEAIEELCDVIIANYNGYPHDGNDGFSPLEVFGSRIEQGMFIANLPEENRDSVTLFPIICVRQVKGNLEQGRRPFINYKNERYTSPELSRDFSMVSEKVTILINTEDLRTVVIYRQDGSKYGVLTCSGYWGTVQHSLKLRDAINKFRRERYFFYTDDEDPMDAFQAFLEENAINDKKLRNLLAEIKSYKKRYNIDSKNKEKKKVLVKLKKEQQILHQEVIDDRKVVTIEDISRDNPNNKQNDEFKSTHDLIIEQKINQREKCSMTANTNSVKDEINLNNINPEITETNYYDHLINVEKNKNKNKRKSISL
ncbi:hypothetical protein MPH48_08835 [Lysinibacillus fusiformis]|uniref:hypothetical protein n=1 Tax=Lysinibacillus fusiformis TaxID=28031 RepID=UPI001F4DB56B|nr:hypothetical protein [Lysinibacillus fusiformis]MCK1988214.1 hypothetical protein [Lysinibacillus fusiformis]